MEFHIDTAEFNASLARYVQVAKKDMATILNTKAWYVARKACWWTQRADKKKIKDFAEGMVWASKAKYYNSETGRLKTLKYNVYAKTADNRPVVALLINKNRGSRGEKGFRGQDMTGAMENFMKFRMGSIGFIASGWIAAIRVLDPKAEEKAAAAAVAGVKVYGVPKGGATFATEDNLNLSIFNHAKALSDKTGEVWTRVANEGLQVAIRDETASMDEYAAKKMQARADKLKA